MKKTPISQSNSYLSAGFGLLVMGIALTSSSMTQTSSTAIALRASGIVFLIIACILLGISISRNLRVTKNKQ